MAKISGGDIRPGMVIEHEGSLWAAVKTMAVKPGKGPAYNQVELKNLLDGRKLNQRFGTDSKVEETHVERRQFQYLYKQGDQLVFMDTASYDQIELPQDFVGERAAFLRGLEMDAQRPAATGSRRVGHGDSRLVEHSGHGRVEVRGRRGLDAAAEHRHPPRV